ncbi:MAG: ABC transporter ATP-binding protein [Solirubrobacterales bacterium]
MAAAIEIQNLRVVRGDNEVLPDLTIQVPSGTVTGLMGPSGCGKSTLMRAIVGVQKVAGGDVTVLGEPAGSAALRSKVGYVTQAPSVYTDLTVRENLSYFASIAAVPHERIDAVIETVDLGRFADRVAANLSGGQRSRVSLAAALLGEPAVLVLDEPTVGLDPVLRKSLWELFHRLAGGGSTLLVSSHVMDEASRCDQLILMREGRIITETTPNELLTLTGASEMEDAFLRLIESAETTAP